VNCYMFKKIFIGLSVAFFGLIASTSTAAAAYEVGNDNNVRPTTDTYQNFTIIDTNNSADFTGFLVAFKYYAANTNPFRFVVVDEANTVRWVSNEITPPGAGKRGYNLPSNVYVEEGWNVGMYFKNAGTIPFSATGSAAFYTPNNSGQPAVGSVLSYEGNQPRTYSLVAVGKPLVLSVKPWEYDPDGTGTVYSEWVRNIGLTDNSGNKKFGLMLSKNAETATNSAPGADVSGVKDITLTEIGFDLRNGGHCGAGAPRFNVVTNDNVTHFVGCTYATNSGTPASGWTRKLFTEADLANPAKVFPPISAGSTVKSIGIVMDEGTDIAPDFSGLSIIDNVNINGVRITKPGSVVAE
jgi:hypothetical protein